MAAYRQVYGDHPANNHRWRYLVQLSTASAVDDADDGVVVQQLVHTRATGAVTGTQVERRHASAVVVVHAAAEIQQSLPPTTYSMAAQRKTNCLGKGAEIKPPNALRSEMPKVSREVVNGEGVSPFPAD